MNQEKLIEYILENKHRAVFIFSIIGLLISLFYELTMDKDAWFWFFSSISQTLAALIALIAIFLISHLESYNSQIKNEYNNLRLIIPDIISDKTNKYFVAPDKLLKADSDKLAQQLDPYEFVLWKNSMSEILNIEQKRD